MLASFCGACGLQFQASDTFCARCGSPRDTDMSGPTALIVSASDDASTVLNSNPRTICLNCGQPRSATVFPCPFCNSSVPTIRTQGMPIEQQLASDVPTPPLIVKDPTSQQSYAAMMGTVNPYGYGLWGDLVVDGSKKNVWDTPQLIFYSGSRTNDYKKGIENLGLITRIDAIGAIYAMQGISYQDFAYQVAVTVNQGTGAAGIAFRVDDMGKECSILDTSRGEKDDKEYLVGFFYDLVSHIRKDTVFSYVKTGKSSTTSLLAVVAQGTVLDFYCDLVHLGRVHVPFTTSGSIGLYNAVNPHDFRYTKLWVKNP